MKAISSKALTIMAALLALHDIEQGRCDLAEKTLNALIDKLNIKDIKKLLSKRVKMNNLD